MYLVGLTGGIASGKTTVARRLVEHGAIEIDADILARQAVNPGSPALREIVQRFGQQMIKADGELDRTALAAAVFSEPGARKDLEAIVHPEVRRLAAEALAQQPDDAIVLYTVPLLVEANVDLPFDLVVTVEAPEATQIERMISSRGMNKDAATARIRAQASPAARANRADVILNSNQSLPEMNSDIDALWRKIVSNAQAKVSQ